MFLRCLPVYGETIAATIRWCNGASPEVFRKKHLFPKGLLKKKAKKRNNKKPSLSSDSMIVRERHVYRSLGILQKKKEEKKKAPKAKAPKSPKKLCETLGSYFVENLLPLVKIFFSVIKSLRFSHILCCGLVSSEQVVPGIDV